MPRQAAASVQRDFKRGLITEATGLNFPEDAVVETDNCEFDLLGRVSRREGFDLETGFTTQTIDKTLSSISSYVWKNVTGDGLLSFVVTQIGTNLYFYDATNTTSLSAGYKSTVIDLTAFSPSGAPTARINECQFSDGFGKLFVFHPNLETFYVTYTLAGDSFAATQINLSIRDFQGSSDGLAIDNRPTYTVSGMNSGNPQHAYNLNNQGWNSTVLAAWDTAFTTMPSNCDVWWNYKNTSDVFDTTTVANSAAGNTLANKGHYILNAYNMDRNTASGLSNVTATTSGTQRASTGVFYAGRVWYTGVNAVGYNSNVYFSQIVENTDQFGYCYQANDPTAEDLFDIEVNDGGVLNIPEAGTIYKLFPIQNTLVVFGAKGIWSISGNQGIGFTATDFAIRHVSSIRSISPYSYVDINGFPMFWNSDGMFAVTAQQSDQFGGQVLQVVPATFSTIQTFYDEIPNANKQFARGFFNPTTQIAQWLYRSTTPSTIEDNYIYDKVLVFNARSQSFYNWTISDIGVKVHSVFVTDASGAQTIEYTVIDAAAETVIDAASDTVVAYASSTTSLSPTFKYLVSYPYTTTYKFTMADTQDDTYTDWITYDSVGTDYSSYFISGYKLKGNGITRFQPNYLFFYNEGVGAFDIKGIWDYALSGSTGKFTSTQRLTYDAAAYSNAHKKVKIRGSGRELQFEVSSVTGQPFTLVGWGSFDYISQLP